MEQGKEVTVTEEETMRTKKQKNDCRVSSLIYRDPLPSTTEQRRDTLCLFVFQHKSKNIFLCVFYCTYLHTHTHINQREGEGEQSRAGSGWFHELGYGL